MTAKWGGSYSRQARKDLAPQLPTPCAKCGLMVTADMRWHAGHQQDRDQGGTNERSNLAIEHGSCNEAAGGRLAQAKRRAPAPPKVKRRAW